MSFHYITGKEALCLLVLIATKVDRAELLLKKKQHAGHNKVVLRNLYKDISRPGSTEMNDVQVIFFSYKTRKT